MVQTKFAAIHGGLLARKGGAAPMISSFSGGMAPGVRQHENAPAGRGQETKVGMRVGKLPTRRAQTDMSAPPSPSRGNGAQACPGPCLPTGDDRAGPRIPASSRPSAGRAEKRHRVSVRLAEEQKRRLVTAAAQLGLAPARLAARAVEAYLDQLSECELGDCACMQRQAKTD